MIYTSEYKCRRCGTTRGERHNSCPSCNSPYMDEIKTDVKVDPELEEWKRKKQLLEAAAPDLYEAAKGLRDNFHGHTLPEFLDWVADMLESDARAENKHSCTADRLQEHARELRAAIAKAEGKE